MAKYIDKYDICQDNLMIYKFVVTTFFLLLTFFSLNLCKFEIKLTLSLSTCEGERMRPKAGMRKAAGRGMVAP